jgi:hypothetical protein
MNIGNLFWVLFIFIALRAVRLSQSVEFGPRSDTGSR